MSGQNDKSMAVERVVLQFDLRVFRLTAIKKAAYKFGDRFYVQLETEGDERVRVILTAQVSTPSARDVAGDFNNEVLDQDLREIVAKETEEIRNLLLAHAFSRASLIDPELETIDFRTDPAIADRRPKPETP